MTKKNKINKKEKELIIARLEVLSPDVHFSDGEGAQTLSRDEIIKHIMNDDDVGKEFVEVELEFLRALKNGEFTRKLVSE